MKEKVYLLVTHQTSYFSEEVQVVFEKAQKIYYPFSKMVFPNAYFIKTTDSRQDIIDNIMNLGSPEEQGVQLGLFGDGAKEAKEPLDFDWIVVEVEKGSMFYTPYAEGVEFLFES